MQARVHRPTGNSIHPTESTSRFGGRSPIRTVGCNVKGTKAPQAAGKIHSDFERGFIRAEVVSFDDLMECGTMAVAKEKGLVRSEGKEYVMQDGDIVLFRFNV